MRSIINGQPHIKASTPLGKLIILLANEFNYPYDTKNEYHIAIKENADRFIQIVDSFTESDPFIDKLKANLQKYKELSAELSNTVSFYLEGNAFQAYKSLEKILSLPYLKEYWDKLLLEINDIYSMYRIRESNIPINQMNEIFHVPFKLRHKVKTQRYSIAGVPCLYLGSSIFTCWLELGQPDLNNLYVSCFKPSNRKPLKVFDFSISLDSFIPNTDLNELWEEDKEDKEYIEATVATWVFTQACSFKRKNNFADFHVEYIIPGLLLQWVKNNATVDGIRYQSTHFNFKPTPNLGHNYVFPTKTNTGDFCRSLSNAFVFTKPTSWQILQSLISKRILGTKIDAQISNNFEDQLLMEYPNTSFGTIEHLISTDSNKMASIENI